MDKDRDFIGETKKRENGIFKRWLAVILFVVFILVIGLVLNSVLRKKWNYSTDNAAQQIVQGYYKEKDHTIDVLALGASTMRNGISSLEMFHEYGFTTYSRATSIQPPVVAYHLLLETLRTQDIKAVILDATSLGNTLLSSSSKKEIAGKMHEAIDYMPWSSDKINLINDVLKMDLPLSFTDFLFPIYAYHDRWSELTRDDFVYKGWQDDYSYKGQYPAINTNSFTFSDDYMAEVADETEEFWVDEEQVEYCLKMIQLCREKDIKFILAKTPNGTWSTYKHLVIERFAQENDVPFIDFNLSDLQAAISFNPRQDFCDAGKHPNILGAQKISRYLGWYLSSVCDFEDKRNNDEYVSWLEDYRKYETLLADAEFRRENNFISFLNALNNPNYITMIATKYTTATHYNEYEAKAFSELGIDVPFGDYEYLSYVAIVDGGKMIYEAMDDNPFGDNHTVSYSLKINGHDVTVSSYASRTSNEASIEFDGKRLSPNSNGFNFVVYDKSVDQVISQRSFNTGAYDYSPPRQFSDVINDPVAYLEQVCNEDYLVVMGVCGDATRYVPGNVNEKLSDMGLKPLDGEFGKPYLAIMDGREVVYNVIGEPESEISVDYDVNGIKIIAVSSTKKNSANYYSLIGESSLKTQNPGFVIRVYNKAEDEIISERRFTWNNNYVTGTNFSRIESISELLSIARQENEDVICVYAPETATEGVPEDVVDALRAYGFSQLDTENCFVGVVTADRESLYEKGAEAVSLSYERGGKEFEISAGNEGSIVKHGNMVYIPSKGGIYLILYHAEQDAILTEKYYANVQQKADDPFSGVFDNPSAYLDLTKNEDYITVIGVSGYGSKYMPGSVNEKMSEMGLLPLNKEINRPYLAVLDGTNVVYNVYGEVDSEISANLEVNGIKITAVSNSNAEKRNFYSLIGNSDLKTVITGLIIRVYSKSQGVIVSERRFTWSSNYATGTNYSSISNINELISSADSENVDILCLYSPDRIHGSVPNDVIEALRMKGFDDLDTDTAFVGVVTADGEYLYNDGEDSAHLVYDRGNTMLELTADSTSNQVKHGGALYTASKDGIYIVLYYEEKDAVLAEKYYQGEENDDSQFRAVLNDPIGYLAQVGQEPYITVIGVCGSGSRYMPGIVNDRLSEMGLLRLDGEFNRPYIAVLDGKEVVYNQYGDPDGEISMDITVAGINMITVSNARESTKNFYSLIGDSDLKTVNTGLLIRVYDKIQQKVVSERRFSWNVNYLTGTDFSRITNINELLFAAKQDGDDIICLYSPAKCPDGIPEDVFNALRGAGFDLKPEENYIGTLFGEELNQESGTDEVKVIYDRNGAGITLTAGADCTAEFSGVRYSMEQEGLWLIVYNPAGKAVLTERYYMKEAVKKVDPFKGLSKNPVEYLKTTANEDFITVIAVSVDGARYLPGTVNDQMEEMGLISLKGKMDQPYIAILNGSEIVYNEVGDTHSELVEVREVEGIQVSAISSTIAKKSRVSLTVGEKVYSKKTHGFTVLVYSKSQGAIVNTRRFDWSTINYVTSSDYGQITNVRELIVTAQREGNDVICLYTPAEDMDESVITVLRGYGFEELSMGNYYAGVLKPNGECIEKSGTEAVNLEYEGIVPVVLSSDEKGMTVDDDGTIYTVNQKGVCILIYHNQDDTMLAEKNYGN